MHRPISVRWQTYRGKARETYATFHVAIESFQGLATLRSIFQCQQEEIFYDKNGDSFIYDLIHAKMTSQRLPITSGVFRARLSMEYLLNKSVHG